MRIVRLVLLGVIMGVVVFFVLHQLSPRSEPRPDLTPPDVLFPADAIHLYWSHDAGSIIVENEESVTIWRLANQDPTSMPLISDMSTRPYAIVWSPSDELIAVGVGEGALSVFDADTQELQFELPLHDQRIGHIMWHPDGDLIAAAERDAASIVSISDEEVVATFEGLKALEWSSDGDLLLAKRSLSVSLQIWDAHTFEPLSSIDSISERRISPTDNKIAGRQRTVITVWDLTTGQILTQAEQNFSDYSIEWNLNGRYIASSVGGYSGWEEKFWTPDMNSIRIWDTQTGKLVITLESHQAPVIYAIWDASGEHVVSYSLDDTVRVWDVQTGAVVKEIVLPIRHSRVAVSPLGDKVAMVDSDGQVAIWNLQD